MCLHTPYRKIHLSTEAHFPWIGISPFAFASAAFRIPRIPRPIPRIPRFTAAAPIPRHSARSGLFRAIPRPVSFRADPQIPRGAE